MLISLPGIARAGAARHRHAPPKGCPATRQLIAADQQAEVYFTRDIFEELEVRACTYENGRTFGLLGCGQEASRVLCGRTVRLAGSDVAFQLDNSRWFLEIVDLRTGRTLHTVPTGSPLEPGADYYGVGEIVALVLKSDGSAAWIANDYERSTGLVTPHETPYFDVEAIDKSGTRLLAAGTDIDPSSLALGSGGSNIAYTSQSVASNTVYWTQAGQVLSAPLN